MRTAALVFLFCLSNLANAQFRYEYPLICDETPKVLQALSEKYQEKINWTGNHLEDKSVYSLWVNEKTGSWTLLKMNVQFACILGVGENSKLSPGDSI